MRRFEFETHRWSRVRDEERILECVIVAVRDGWTALGYEVRLYSHRHLMYRSRPMLERRLAVQEADSLLRETLASVQGESSRIPIDASSTVRFSSGFEVTPGDAWSPR